MAYKIPESVVPLLTTKRIFVDNGKKVEKDFRPVLQNVGEQEILFIYEIIKKKHGSKFTIDLIKNIPEEKVIYFRGTFDYHEFNGKGTIYLDSETYEILFDNLDRLLEKAGVEKIRQLI